MNNAKYLTELYYDIDKQQTPDWKIGYAYYKNNNELAIPRFSFIESDILDDKFINKINQRELLKSEICLEYDPPKNIKGTIYAYNNFINIINELEKDNIYYKAYGTKNHRAFRIEIYFKELATYERAKREEIRYNFIKKYNCDTQLKSDKHLVSFGIHYKTNEPIILIKENYGINNIDILNQYNTVKEDNDRNNIRSGYDLIKNGVEPIEWDIENIVRTGGITIFGGTAGTMKTYTAIYLSLCAINKIKYLNEFETKKIKVLYIDEENGDQVIANRLSSIMKGMELHMDNLQDIYFSIFNNYKLDNDEIIEKLKNKIEQYQPNLIIFDSMVRCMEGEEDKSKDVRLIFDNLKEIFNQYNTSFIILHHTAKGQKGLNALRGSGDFAGMADVVLMFERLVDGGIKASFEKNRHIDTTKLKNFNFKPIEYNDGIKFELLGYNSDNISKRDECMKSFLEFADDKGSIGFKKIEAINELKSLGFSQSLAYEVITLAINSRIIKWSGKLLEKIDSFQQPLVEEI